MAREGFMVYHDWEQLLSAYSDTEVGRIIRMLLTYSQTGVYEEPKGNERFIMPALLGRIDKDSESYEAKCSRNSTKAKSRWATNSDDTQYKPQHTDDATACNGMPQHTDDATACNGMQTYASDANINLNINLNNISPNGDIYPSSADNAANDVNEKSPFDKFWAEYPRKVGKADAKKAFGKVKVPVQTLVDAVKQQKQSDQWTKDNGQYIPNPATWLRQGRWEDVLPVGGNNAIGKGRNIIQTRQIPADAPNVLEQLNARPRKLKRKDGE